ncbi:MAG: response regulator transcription factor [Pirellulaceae bacterium]
MRATYLPEPQLESVSKTVEVRVIVVDDDPGVLTVIGQLLRTNGFNAEEYSTPMDCLASISPNDIGCVITDLEMPNVNGIELQKRLIDLGSCLSVIVVTAHADVPRTIQIMSQGAITLLEKPFKSQQLVEAVQEAVIASHKSYDRKIKIAKSQSLIAELNDEELEIMKLAAAGLPNKTISQKLDLSPRTIDRRRQSALAKLDVVSVADFAVLYATSRQELT